VIERRQQQQQQQQQWRQQQWQQQQQRPWSAGHPCRRGQGPAAACTTEVS
jgi:hypothetical protein